MRKKQRYVYYDKKTGRIKDILNKRKRGRAPYITCSLEDVIGFLAGTESKIHYVVAYNRETKKTVLMKKDNIIKFRAPSKKLTKIPYKVNTESDLTLIYYSDNVLEVTLDVSRISPLYQTNFREEVTFERGTEFRITLKEKDSGNLLKELVLDAQDLLNHGQLFFELEDHIYPNNVEFFTYKVLNTYSWFKGKIKLISPAKEKIKFDIHKADNQPRSKDFTYHLIVEMTKEGLRITNNIDNLKLIRVYDQIEFFIVDEHDPNILYEKFSLTEEDLENKVIVVPLDCDTKGKNILYNHKHISVLKEEENE